MMYEVSFFHALKESSRTTMSTTVIVGAGFAGLYTALKLGSRDITIVDRRSKPGGRARTATEDGGVLYEQGPWRVHQSHDLFIKLCREFDMPLEPNSSSLSGGGRPDGPDRLESYFDRGILEKGLVDAQRAENASGYTGADIGPYGSYRTSSLDGRFLVLGGGGFEELARRMAAKLAERGVSIRYGFLVEDVVMEEGSTASIIEPERAPRNPRGRGLQTIDLGGSREECGPLDDRETLAEIADLDGGQHSSAPHLRPGLRSWWPK